jgi:speckle-type POZ protein
MVGGYQWQFEYYPNGYDPSCADFISLYVGLVNNESVQPDVQLPVEVYLNFSFVDQVEKQRPLSIRMCYNTCSFSSMDVCWGHHEFFRRDVLERSFDMKDDCFTIRCDIMVCKNPNPSRDAAEALMSDIDQHFYNLLQNKVGVDATFEVGGETFSAHRCVLAARSPVFMAQLFGPMKEGTTSTVIHIKDMDAKVFRTLLTFIYTGSFATKENRTQVVEGEEDVEYVEYIMW